jgi:hypothetical protein
VGLGDNNVPRERCACAADRSSDLLSFPDDSIAGSIRAAASAAAHQLGARWTVKIIGRVPRRCTSLQLGAAAGSAASGFLRRCVEVHRVSTSLKHEQLLFKMDWRIRVSEQRKRSCICGDRSPWPAADAAPVCSQAVGTKRKRKSSGVRDCVAVTSATETHAPAMADSFQISPTELKFKFELRKTIPVTLNLRNQVRTLHACCASGDSLHGPC